ncbi:hypothetical protein BJX70DRAFT_360657 [Aspergillus crustosus]
MHFRRIFRSQPFTIPLANIVFSFCSTPIDSISLNHFYKQMPDLCCANTSPSSSLAISQAQRRELGLLSSLLSSLLSLLLSSSSSLASETSPDDTGGSGSTPSSNSNMMIRPVPYARATIDP